MPPHRSRASPYHSPSSSASPAARQRDDYPPTSSPLFLTSCARVAFQRIEIHFLAPLTPYFLVFSASPTHRQDVVGPGTQKGLVHVRCEAES
jgi:hypothetical protein